MRRVSAVHFATLITLVGFLLAPAAVPACSFDTDCSPGSHCLKSQGALYGTMRGLPGSTMTIPSTCYRTPGPFLRMWSSAPPISVRSSLNVNDKLLTRSAPAFVVCIVASSGLSEEPYAHESSPSPACRGADAV